VSIKIPQPFAVDADFSGSVGPVGPVTVNAGVTGSFGPVGPITLAGIPDPFKIDVTHLPKIQIGLDPITLNPLTINPVTVNPLTLNLAIRELPSVRAHLPANFRVGFSILGFELFSVRLCGEAQIITEPYVPNPCERCEPPPP
jgi:hypothetical protein